MTIVTLLLILLIACLAGAIASLTRRLKALDTACEAAEENLAFLETQRHHLLQDLLNALRAFTEQDRQSLERVAANRAAALRAVSAPARLLAEIRLNGASDELLNLANSSPLLRASQEFNAFRVQIEQNERDLSMSRQIWLTAVRDYNEALKSFPLNYLAERLRFAQRAFCDIGSDGEAVEGPVA